MAKPQCGDESPQTKADGRVGACALRLRKPTTLRAAADKSASPQSGDVSPQSKAAGGTLPQAPTVGC